MGPCTGQAHHMHRIVHRLLDTAGFCQHYFRLQHAVFHQTGPQGGARCLGGPWIDKASWSKGVDRKGAKD